MRRSERAGLGEHTYDWRGNTSGPSSQSHDGPLWKDTAAPQAGGHSHHYRADHEGRGGAIAVGGIPLHKRTEHDPIRTLGLE